MISKSTINILFQSRMKISNSCNKLLLTSSVHNSRMTVQCWCVAGRRLASAAPTCRRLESCMTGRVSPCPTVSSHRGPAWGRGQAGATRRQRPPSGLYLAQGSRLVIRNGLFVVKFSSYLAQGSRLVIRNGLFVVKFSSYLAQGSRLVIRNGLFVVKFTSMNFYLRYL